MGAIRTKLESYKKPAQGKIMRGSGKMPKFGPSKSTGGKGNMLSMVRMAMAAQRRAQASQDRETMADALGTVRQGTMDRDALMLHQIDASMAGVDQLLQSLWVE